MFRAIYIILSSFCVTYFMTISYGGLANAPVSATQALFTLPLYIGSFLFIVTFVVEIIVYPSRGNARKWIVLLSLLLMVGGYWVNAFMGYSAEVVVTEGQTVMPRDIPNMIMAEHVGKKAAHPTFGFSLTKLIPVFDAEGKVLKELTAKFSQIASGSTLRPFTVSGEGAYSLGGFSLSIEGFGYSPRYELLSGDGKFIDSTFVYLNIFPPGAEDSFRLLSPLTYYLRYEPAKPGETSEPIINVRVARNKDVVFNDKVTLGEDFRYENVIMRFPEVRQWTKCKLRKWPGNPIFLTGVVLALATLIWSLKNTPSAKE